jgi:hypothetical protein
MLEILKKTLDGINRNSLGYLLMVRARSLTSEQRRSFASWLGKRSYKARLERLGLREIQRIARENGKKGGRPPKART